MSGTAAPGNLEALYQAAHSRMTRLPDGFRFRATPYHPLADFVHQALHFGGERYGMALAACQQVVDADDPALARMVLDLRVAPGFRTGLETTAARVAQHQVANASLDVLRPRISPAEMVSRFAERGVLIRAVDGDLHVSPVELLSEADRTLLRECKPAIVALLSQPAEVF